MERIPSIILVFFIASIEGLFLELVDSRYSSILEPGRLRVMHDVLDCVEFPVKALDIAVVVALLLVVLSGLKPCHQFFICSESEFVHFSISLFWFFCNYDTASLYKCNT